MARKTFDRRTVALFWALGTLVAVSGFWLAYDLATGEFHAVSSVMIVSPPDHLLPLGVAFPRWLDGLIAGLAMYFLSLAYTASVSRETAFNATGQYFGGASIGITGGLLGAALYGLLGMPAQILLALAGTAFVFLGLGCIVTLCCVGQDVYARGIVACVAGATLSATISGSWLVGLMVIAAATTALLLIVTILAPIRLGEALMKAIRTQQAKETMPST